MGSSSPSPSPPPAPPQSSAPARGASNASLRWQILRRALLARSASSRASDGITNDQQKIGGTNKISRKASRGFNLIECHVVPVSQLHKSQVNSLNGNGNGVECQKDVYVCYKLPCGGSPELNVMYRREDSLELNDIEASNRYNIDTTGLVCCWPSEEVLAFYCINHSDMFRSKRVLELGAGYGLAGLVIAASANANEVIISDGNPQVVGYIQKNISINVETFDRTKVKSMTLHWDQEQPSEMFNSFDIIVASDCTFFKQFHRSLARVVKSLLKHSEASQAIFVSPKRGDSLNKFLEIIKEYGLHYELRIMIPLSGICTKNMGREMTDRGPTITRSIATLYWLELPLDILFDLRWVHLYALALSVVLCSFSIKDNSVISATESSSIFFMASPFFLEVTEREMIYLPNPGYLMNEVLMDV